MSGVYLVALCAHLAGGPDDGVRDSLSAGSSGERREAIDLHVPTPCLLAAAPLFDGETSVSCLLVTAVQTRVHITFPVPFTLAIYLFLANRFGDDSRPPGVCTQIVYP